MSNADDGAPFNPVPLPPPGPHDLPVFGAKQPLDLDAVETRIHALPPCELTGIALALVAEVRRLREEIA